jgi:hypothetical protein
VSFESLQLPPRFLQSTLAGVRLPDCWNNSMVGGKVSGVHRMSGVCGHLPSKGHVDDERIGGSAKAPGNSSMAYGGGNRVLVSRHRGLRESLRSVEHQPPRRHT